MGKLWQIRRGSARGASVECGDYTPAPPKWRTPAGMEQKARQAEWNCGNGKNQAMFTPPPFRQRSALAPFSRRFQAQSNQQNRERGVFAKNMTIGHFFAGYL